VRIDEAATRRHQDADPLFRDRDQAQPMSRMRGWNNSTVGSAQPAAGEGGGRKKKGPAKAGPRV
jgi:hypothetical protein